MRATLKDIDQIKMILSETGGPAGRVGELLTLPDVLVLMPNAGSVFIGFPINPDICSGHVYVLKSFRGGIAINAERDTLVWVLKNTDYKAVIGFTPEDKKNVVDFHRRAGMTELGKTGGNIVFCYDGGE